MPDLTNLNPSYHAAVGLARKLLWIAFAWNDHNFDHPKVEAKKTAAAWGLTTQEEADAWLVALPDVLSLPVYTEYTRKLEELDKLEVLLAPYRQPHETNVSCLKRLLAPSISETPAPKKEEAEAKPYAYASPGAIRILLRCSSTTQLYYDKEGVIELAPSNQQVPDIRVYSCHVSLPGMVYIGSTVELLGHSTLPNTRLHCAVLPHADDCVEDIHLTSLAGEPPVQPYDHSKHTIVGLYIRSQDLSAIYA